MKTVAEVDRVIEQFEEIQQMAVPIAEIMLELELDRPVTVEPNEIVVEDGMLQAKVEVDYRCGDWQTYTRYIPTEYLFDHEWEKKFKHELALAHEKKMEEKRLAQAKARREKEDRERQEYLKLKAKFEK